MNKRINGEFCNIFSFIWLKIKWTTTTTNNNEEMEQKSRLMILTFNWLTKLEYIILKQKYKEKAN